MLYIIIVNSNKISTTNNIINNNSNNNNNCDHINININNKIKEDDEENNKKIKNKSDLNEFYIEHEISTIDANLAAKRILFNSNNNLFNKKEDQQHNDVSSSLVAGGDGGGVIAATVAGCLKCTTNEIRYCLGPSLINDHCCCDRRFIVNGIDQLSLANQNQEILKLSTTTNPKTIGGGAAAAGFLKRIFTEAIDNGGSSGFFGKPFPASYDLFDSTRKGCPLCDSSVYGYCSDKLLHDACCCLNPYEDQLPYQCRFADCSFLHANSCREHRLITRCCCNNLYLAKNN